MEIKLQGAKNLRDLGGTLTLDGKKVKSGRIIRSSNLSCITNEDEKILSSYGLKKIVDFRTDAEVDAAPDIVPSGTTLIRTPILKALTAGITRKDDIKKPIEEILLDFSLDLGTEGPAWLARLYIPLVSDEFSLKGYRNFLDILKDNKDGAVLYHCTAGKDRVGVGTAIFLLAMNVDRETVMNDYLLTNEGYRSNIDGAMRLGRERGVSEEILNTIPALSGVDKSYLSAAFDTIDTLWGGVDGFFKNALGIDEDYLNELRESYLE